MSHESGARGQRLTSARSFTLTITTPTQRRSLLVVRRLVLLPSSLPLMLSLTVTDLVEGDLSLRSTLSKPAASAQQTITD